MVQILSGPLYLFIVYNFGIQYIFVFVTKGIKGKISEVIDKWFQNELYAVYLSVLNLQEVKLFWVLFILLSFPNFFFFLPCRTKLSYFIINIGPYHIFSVIRHIEILINENRKMWK